MTKPGFYLKTIALITILTLFEWLFATAGFAANSTLRQADTINNALISEDINPDYQNYINEKNLDPDGVKNIIIPSPYKPDPAGGQANSKSEVSSENKSLLQAESIPEKYDLRDESRVTPVKDQAINGLCWAFAANGSYESCIKGKTPNIFSELHMGYALSNTGGNDQGFDRDPNGDYGGGNSDMAAAYYLRWSGPVLEADDPYNSDNVKRSVSITDGKPVAGHCQNIIQIPPPDDTQSSKYANREYIKSYIMKYGGVTTDIFYDDSYCKYGSDGSASYNYNGFEPYQNHAIVLVGWDDTYSPSNFKIGSRPSAPGAFIAKNSWGSSWGSGGYFYISYEDKFVGSGAMVFPELDSSSNYDNIYQYDPLGRTSAIGFGKTSGGYANVYDVKDAWNEVLSAVGFYINGAGAQYEIWVNSSNGDIYSSTMVKSGSVDMPGYYTVKLDQQIPLVGKQFSVAVKIKLDSGYYPIALEKPESGYSDSAVAEPGQSFVTSAGPGEGTAGTWLDITKMYYGSYKNTNTCIKAYTDNENLYDIIPERYNDVNSGNWAKNYIDSISRAGFINGSYENDGWYYRPDDNITRAEFTSIIVRMFAISDSNASCNFEDVYNHWAYKSIASALKYGLVKGVSDNLFEPDDPVTRQDMCVIISRSLILMLDKPDPGPDAGSELSKFDDGSKISDYAKSAVVNDMQYLLITGYYEDGRYLFKPENNATRAEVAKVIYMIYNSLMT